MTAHQQGHDNPIHPVLDTFRLVAETKRQAHHIAESARGAVKAFYRNPADLAAFIERHRTPVYVLNGGWFGAFCLWLLGFEPGFIPPRPDRRYRFLQRFLRGNGFFSLKGQQGDKEGCHFEHGVFVMTRPLFTVGFLSHQLHHWLAFRAGMQGYCDQAQHLYRKFWNEGNGMIGQEVYDMSAEEIMALKAAINRDLEALQFLKAVAAEILVPAKQARSFSDYGKTSA